MTRETETIKDVISQISEKTKKNFGFSYNVENSRKDKTYFERTLAFFKNKDHIEDVNNIINNLDQKSNRFLLIDGENIFFNFSSKISDKLLIADLLEDYLKKNVFIIIFCQEHSILENGRFRGLQNFLNTYLYGFSNLYVFCKLDNNILTEHYKHNLQDIDHAPKISDQSEIDDILLVHCFNKLTKNNDNKVYIKTNDGFDWLDNELKTKIEQARIIAPIDIGNQLFQLQKIANDIKPFIKSKKIVGPIRNTRPSIRVKPYTKKSKGKSKKAGKTKKTRKTKKSKKNKKLK